MKKRVFAAAKKLVVALKHGIKRVGPLLVAGAIAGVGSDSFRHYVEHHPQVSTFVPVLVWLLHALGSTKKTAA